jgi:predicted metal-dependent hydrolase
MSRDHGLFDMLFTMNKTIELNGTKIEYLHKPSRRARRIRLAIYPGGEVRLFTPLNIPERVVNDFLKSKAKWILTKHEQQSQLPKVTKEGNRQEFAQYKSAALELAKTRLEHFNAHYHFKYHKVSVKNNRSLWGSCSKRGNLNFSYKIALLAPDLADYVIVHELCHLKEFNHSPSFWSLVSQAIPDYRQRRSELRKAGLGIS